MPKRTLESTLGCFTVELAGFLHPYKLLLVLCCFFQLSLKATFGLRALDSFGFGVHLNLSVIAIGSRKTVNCVRACVCAAAHVYAGYAVIILLSCTYCACVCVCGSVCVPVIWVWVLHLFFIWLPRASRQQPQSYACCIPLVSSLRWHLTANMLCTMLCWFKIQNLNRCSALMWNL